jgi:XapX domain-containing protein
MNLAFVVAATATGLLVGALFASLRIPIPAPPNFAGVMGIVGIWFGYQLVRHYDVGFDLLASLGY